MINKININVNLKLIIAALLKVPQSLTKIIDGQYSETTSGGVL